METLEGKEEDYFSHLKFHEFGTFESSTVIARVFRNGKKPLFDPKRQLNLGTQKTENVQKFNLILQN